LRWREIASISFQKIQIGVGVERVSRGWGGTFGARLFE
jgi:hypothetical protein